MTAADTEAQPPWAAPLACAGHAPRGTIRRRERRPAPAAGPRPGIAGPATRSSRSASLAAVVGAFAYVGTVDPNQPGHYPVCPLLALTGVYCPGCGGLRSALRLRARGLPDSPRDNALAVVGYLALRRGVDRLGGPRGTRPPDAVTSVPRDWWAWAPLLLVFTVVRNLPVRWLAASLINDERPGSGTGANRMRGLRPPPDTIDMA